MSSLTRFYYVPFTGLERLFGDAFNVRFSPPPSVRVACVALNNSTRHLDSLRPRMDVRESGDSTTVAATFDLPGFKPEDVAIDLQQDRLTVSGESKTSSSHEGNGNGYAIRERRHGKFSRTLQLPFGTGPEDVKAKMENGLLTVTFPKATPKQEPQRIAIE
ncbi:small heat shock protein [Boletus coccyginus]|nr:small heat shock protein [Boletus coccyginus]